MPKACITLLPCRLLSNTQYSLCVLINVPKDSILSTQKTLKPRHMAMPIPGQTSPKAGYSGTPGWLADILWQQQLGTNRHLFQPLWCFYTVKKHSNNTGFIFWSIGFDPPRRKWLRGERWMREVNRDNVFHSLKSNDIWKMSRKQFRVKIFAFWLNRQYLFFIAKWK